MQENYQIKRFVLIVLGLWFPFILGILKMFLTNTTSPFFAKIITGFILGVSYIPVFAPLGVLVIGFLIPFIICKLKNKYFSYKLLMEYEEILAKNSRKAS